MPDQIEGHRILVVGASSGIGAAVVRRGAARGAQVVGAARRVEVLTSAFDGLDNAGALHMDVRDAASVRAGVAAAVDRLGGLDAVVYAAGVSPLIGLGEAGTADWNEVLGTNLVGCAFVATAVAPHLVPTGGRLVVLSSKAVRQPFPGLGLYSVSKVALDGLIRCLPLEHPGLRVTRMVVGNTHDTGFTDGWDPRELGAWMQRWAEQGVLGSVDTMAPDDVADAVLAVLSSAVHIDDIAVLEDPAPVDELSGRHR